MFEHPLFSELFGFASFVSSSYGTGDLTLDSGLAASAILLTALIVQVISLVGLSDRVSARGVEAATQATEVLTEISLQISELKTAVSQEFERCRGEIGYIKQELDDLHRSQSYLDREALVGKGTQVIRVDQLLRESSRERTVRSP